jgi:hypothetical protein
MYKFVATDVSNPPQKRKQPQRACEQCRRKKKRCHHTNAERSPQSYTARSSPQLDGHEGAGLSHSPVSASYRGPSSPVMQHTVQESVQSPPQPNRQAESHRKHGSLSIGGGPNNSEQLRVNQSSRKHPCSSDKPRCHPRGLLIERKHWSLAYQSSEQ